MSFAVTLPFLRPIEPLILDPDLSEIRLNGSSRVFVERTGFVEEVHNVPLSEKNLTIAIKNMARVLGDEINEEKPLLDSRLPEGSRVAAIFLPCSLEGTTPTIRKFHLHRYTAEELVRVVSLPPEVFASLQRAMENRQNILLSGGTGTGKTTRPNALAVYIDEEDRVVCSEDTAEIQLDTPNRRLEARREQPGVSAVSICDLVRATFRPARILLRRSGRGSV